MDSLSRSGRRPIIPRVDGLNSIRSAELNEREEFILRAIVQSYVLSASPIGSNTLLKQIETDMKVSSATIRHVMAKLEDMGYVTHPHTSAGRIPTDKGYRTYVDSLMSIDLLSAIEKQTLQQNILQANTDTLHRDASRILGILSQLLGVVQIPTVNDLIIRGIQLVPLSSIRLLVVLSFDSDVVRTLTMETDTVVELSELDALTRIINERISGKSLRRVREHFPAMMSEHTGHPVIRLFIDSMDRLLFDSTERLHLAGAQNLVQQPEFDSADRLRGVVELIENEDVIVHLLERSNLEHEQSGVQVKIGAETQADLLRDFSFVSAQYRIGAATYSVGLIGPKRMNYSKLISLVGSVASLMTQVYSNEGHS